MMKKTILNINNIAMSIKPLFNLITLCIVILGFSSTKTFAEATAELDRSVISEGESVTLSITSTGKNIAEPDLSEIETLFDIVSQSQSDRYTINNFQQHRLRQWQLHMFPKETGNIIIPRIKVGNDLTQELTLHVKDIAQSKPASPIEDDPVYMNVSVNTHSPYIQQEILLTTQIYQAIQLDNMQISEPKLDNALIRKINQTSFQKTINNINYRVHELTYSIIPQATGEMTIPAFTFSAVALNNRAISFNATPIKRNSQPLSITVKPIPQEYTGKTWLPARSIRLKEQWQDIHAQTGQAITRTITLEADGLLSTQLPELPLLVQSGLQTYPNQPTLSDRYSDKGIQSQREESTAIVPTLPGTYQLPEVKISWWDVDTNQQKEATLPSREFVVSGEPLVTTTPQSAVKNKETTLLASETPQTMTSEDAKPNNLWQYTAIICALGWAISLIVILMRKRSDVSIQNDVLPTNNDEAEAFNALKRTLKTPSYSTLRCHILFWAEKIWPNIPHHTLQSVCTRINDNELTDLITRLEREHYANNSNSENIDFTKVINRIEKWRNANLNKDPTKYTIPDMYDL